MSRTKRSALVLMVVSILVLPLIIMQATEAKTYEFKLSLETVPNHPKTQGVEIFIKELVKASNGRLKPLLFHSAQLYKDTHAVRGLNLGTVEMAVVGNYLLDGFDINTTLTHLPMFFGQPQEITMKLIDGEIGKQVRAKLEKKMKVKVIGRVFEMGFDNCYTLDKKITEIEDFKGLRMRHAGGAVSTRRFKALGAQGVVIAYADVAMALSRGTVDGLATTTKSVESAKLHDSGLKYGLECRNHVSYYYPLVNIKFWESLPADLQKIFMEVWEATVPKEREIARDQQLKAKEFLESKGMEFYEPSVEKLTKWREHIIYIQDDLVKDLEYDPELVDLAMKALGM